MWVWMHCETESLLCKGACHRLLLNLLLKSPDGVMKSVLAKILLTYGTHFWKIHLSQCSLENLFHMEFLNISLFCSSLHRQHLAIYECSFVSYHAWVLTLDTYVGIFLIPSFFCSCCDDSFLSDVLLALIMFSANKRQNVFKI